MGNFCVNCGTELKENADVCLSCGTEFKKISNVVKNSSSEKNKSIAYNLLNRFYYLHINF